MNVCFFQNIVFLVFNTFIVRLADIAQIIISLFIAECWVEFKISNVEHQQLNTIRVSKSMSLEWSFSVTKSVQKLWIPSMIFYKNVHLVPLLFSELHGHTHNLLLLCPHADYKSCKHTKSQSYHAYSWCYFQLF